MMGKPDTYNVSVCLSRADWQDTVRVRYSIRRAQEVDYASESTRLAEMISEFGL